MNIINLLLFILFFFSNSCFSQNNYNIYIVNKSKMKLDSVSIPNFNYNLKKATDSIWNIQVMNVKLRMTDEGAFPIELFLGTENYKWHWGDNDFGYFFNKDKVDSIFIFDNGLSKTSKNIIKPKFIELGICMDNESDKINLKTMRQLNKIDSISHFNGVTGNSCWYTIYINYEQYESNPNFIFRINEKNFPIKLNEFLNFNDWNKNQIFLKYNNNSISLAN